MMTVMTFGATCSPAIAQHIKSVNASLYIKQYPAAVKEIKENHYVDDWVTSFDDEEECINTAKQVKHIHSQAGFNMRGWQTNNLAVRRALSKGQVTENNQPVILCANNEQMSVLGIRWDPETDTLSFTTDR